MPDQKPSVGRIVHYVSYGTPGGEFKSTCRAAIVTEVCDNPDGIDPETGTLCASLAVLNPTGIFLNRHVPQHDPVYVAGVPRGVRRRHLALAGAGLIHEALNPRPTRSRFRPFP